MVEIKNKVCLICIDGWGLAEDNDGNAITRAMTPVMTKLREEYPYATLTAHGEAVGLPAGLMGNSEVGHVNIGAGRVVYQDIVRIDKAVREDAFKTNDAVVEAAETAKKGTGRLHLLGLVSDGGVHSHIKHLFALIRAAKELGIPECYVHAFTDGRDVPPTSAPKYLQELMDFQKEIGYSTLADVTGRYYAMDRDKRWERIQIAYEMLTQGKGEGVQLDALIDTVKKRHESGENDEFLKPIVLEPKGNLADNDVCLFFDFRADRMRQIVETVGLKPPFETSVVPKVTTFTMNQYKLEFPFKQMFPPQDISNVLADVVAKSGVKQYHVAETEKYAHVTFFFNGGVEKECENESRKLVPSPKVATYDLKPEMSAAGVAEETAKGIACGEYDFIVCNFAPPDMVGHTGMFEPARKGVEATDAGIGVIYEACKEHGWTLIVTADHGNAEQMKDAKGEPHTAHTCNRVPLNVVNKKVKLVNIGEENALCDVAPTVLTLMGLEQPSQMTGKSLVEV
eukprot:Clim_evm192s157 gene=Clim_evmTU192s157